GTVLWRSPHLGYTGTWVLDSAHNIYVVALRRIAKFSTTKALTISGANRDALANQDLYLIRVTGDAPNRTEDTLGIVAPDSDGTIQLTPVP
ncbi:MAG: hypothetical protein D6706_06780, partial [Chloroflexi bacterium]